MSNQGTNKSSIIKISNIGLSHEKNRTILIFFETKYALRKIEDNVCNITQRNFTLN